MLSHRHGLVWVLMLIFIPFKMILVAHKHFGVYFPINTAMVLSSPVRFNLELFPHGEPEVPVKDKRKTEFHALK